MVAGSNLPHKTKAAISRTTATSTPDEGYDTVRGGHTGTIKEQTLENVRLENIWQDRLRREGWIEKAVQQLPFAWSSSTLRSYNRSLNRLQAFCSKTDHVFPPTSTSVISEFLCTISEASTRPQSSINTALSALSNLYKGYNMTDPMICNCSLNVHLSSQQQQHQCRDLFVLFVLLISLMCIANAKAYDGFAHFIHNIYSTIE